MTESKTPLGVKEAKYVRYFQLLLFSNTFSFTSITTRNRKLTLLKPMSKKTISIYLRYVYLVTYA